MIKLLNAISKDVNSHLWMIESMGLNPLHLKSEFHNSMLKNIGITYLMKRRIEISIENIERIQKYCLSEINGTFYDDFEKQWEGTEIAPKYTTDTPYEYILGIWDNHPSPEIDFETKAFIELHAQMSTGLTESITKFFPEAGPYKQNSKGEMEKVSMLDSQIDNNLKAGSMLANIEEYNERLAKIKEIATNKGNLGEILNLIGN